MQHATAYDLKEGACPWMPERKPLVMRKQNFHAPYYDTQAPKWQPSKHGWLGKSLIFGPAVLTTALLLLAFTDWLSTAGLGILEYVLILLVGLTFFWVSLSVSMATTGFFRALKATKTANTGKHKKCQKIALDVALLVPVYNENPFDIFGNVAAIFEDLTQSETKHRFSLFILSDTQNPDIAVQEEHAMQVLRASFSEKAQIFYRRRAKNTDHKTGNLTDWIENWGGGSDAMIVLDADSLMTGEAIITLSDELAHDPTAGLIQSCPRLFGAETLFARIQQFSNVTYGGPLSEGLAFWSDKEGNYWGHNAIIRTSAFAASARLPYIKSLKGEDSLILSHDFVEASMLRRAGWAVRFLPDLEGSYEEAPATLIDYVLRDRRWCQGNLQHLRLLFAAGFHIISRFHLFHGAISYLLSPAWFVLLIIWALIGNGEANNVISYFTTANPQMPVWPHVSTVNSVLILIFIYTMLLAPKIIGAVLMCSVAQTRKAYGGIWRFCASFLIEVIASIAYAPVLMIQQTLAVLRCALGYRATWTPQQRRGGRYRPIDLVKFHILELCIGALLLTGMFMGLISLWLLPIAVSLFGAIILSGLSGLKLSQTTWMRDYLTTPEDHNVPNVITLSRQYSTNIQAMMNNRSQSAHIAAE